MSEGIHELVHRGPNRGILPRARPSAPGERSFLTADQVAHLIGVSRKTIYVLVERGQLACYRLGRQMRFSRTHLEDFLRSVEQEAG
ncbi:MAG: helix-turn-helix domain-containing protein [Actinomycetota bacterium]